MDANEVCQGIQTVRVEPATRSAVATCKYIKKETSQLAGKGYKDSDYTLVIAIMHGHKRTIIVQKLTLVVEL